MISIIVLTKNSEKHIKTCMDSINIQTYPSTEVIVVDAGSTDDTKTILSEYDIKLVNVDKKTSIGKARQIGFERSSGNIIAYIDSDVELPHENWIKHMLEPFRTPSVAGVQTLAKCRDSDPAILKMVHSRFEYKNKKIDIDNYEPVGTSHLLLRRVAIESVGGFIDTNFGEDTDLTRKIMEQGHYFVYLPNEKCYHYHVDNHWGYLKKEWRNKKYTIYGNLKNGADVEMPALIKLSKWDKLKFLSTINGKTTQDKVIVFKSVYSYLVNDTYTPSKDTIVNSGKCRYYCRHNTNDLNLILFHEEQFKRFFNVPDGVFIDIGAHIGKHAIYSAVNRARLVMAIEPCKENFSVLKTNISLNKLSNIHPINCACWDKDEDIKMYYDSNGNNSVIDEISDIYETVEGIRLDKLTENLHRVDIIKIDVERAEPNVLKGATNTLERFHPKIVFEAFNEGRLNETLKVLKPFNYNTIQISSCDYLAE